MRFTKQILVDTWKAIFIHKLPAHYEKHYENQELMT